MLKPQDILLACKVFGIGTEEWPLRRLAGSISISLGEAHASVGRCREAGILAAPRGRLSVVRKGLFRLVSVSAPQVYYAVRGRVDAGVPTSIHAEPLAGVFGVSDGAIPLVWPCDLGTVRGETLVPLYPTVPRAIRHDPSLHRLLALIDVVRAGGPAERRLATDLLERMILGDGRTRDGRSATAGTVK
jgi:hypothetical protein